MIAPKRFREYLVEIKAEIESINKCRMVIDDSQVVEVLKSMKSSDNLLLLGIIPEYNSGTSKSLDNVNWQTHTAFLVLKYVNYSSLKEDDEAEVWEETFQAANKLKEKILYDAGAGSNTCPEISNISEKSLDIQPVWKLGGCNGYILTASFN